MGSGVLSSANEDVTFIKRVHLQIITMGLIAYLWIQDVELFYYMVILPLRRIAIRW